MKTLSTVLCIAGLAMITLSGCGGSSTDSKGSLSADEVKALKLLQNATMSPQ